MSNKGEQSNHNTYRSTSSSVPYNYDISLIVFRKTSKFPNHSVHCDQEAIKEQRKKWDTSLFMNKITSTLVSFRTYFTTFLFEFELTQAAIFFKSNIIFGTQ